MLYWSRLLGQHHLWNPSLIWRRQIANSDSNTLTNSSKNIALNNSVWKYCLQLTIVIDLPIAINIGFTNHLIDFVVRQFLACTQEYAKVNSRTREQLQKDTPRLVMTCLSSAALMNPLPSLSKTLNASFISSSLSVSRIFRAIIVRNSGKSIVPFPSASTSLIMSCSSASVGFCPSERITVPSSCVVIVPSPSWRNWTSNTSGDYLNWLTLIKKRKGLFELWSE